MSVSTDPRIGTEFLGYRIEALVGRGGMGVVYKAYDSRLKRNVALKLIAPELSEDAPFRERFLAETELAASLEHPNVVPIHDAGEVDGQLYIAMRYVEGSDLKTLLAEQGVLEPVRALAVCSQVADALDHAHERGLVHRDVKPSNVLLDRREHVYLADFGLSRRLDEPGIPSGPGPSLGTPAYAAPEQIEGRDVDGRADVYSLGCVLYECLTGEVPFKRDSELALLWAHVQEPPPKPSEHEPDLRSEIDAVIATAMAKDPDNRYASCGELIEASSEALGVHRSVTVRDRKALILTALGVAIVAAAVVAGVLLSQSGRGKPSVKPTPTPKVDSLQQIDPKTNTLVKTIGGVGSNPKAIAVGAGSVWVGSEDDGTVARVDPKTNSIRTINTGRPQAIAIRDGKVLVSNQFGTLSTIDPARMSISTSDQPGFGYISFALGEGALWGLFGGLDRINHGGQVVKRIPTQLEPFAVAAGEGAVWVLDGALRSSVMRVDPATNTVVKRLQLRFEPGGIAVGGGSVWVTNPSGGSVVRIDARSNRIVGSTRVGRDPVAIAVGFGSVWVANYQDGTVTRIDSRDGSVVKTIRVGPYPATLATGLGELWVGVRAA